MKRALMKVTVIINLVLAIVFVFGSVGGFETGQIGVFGFIVRFAIGILFGCIFSLTAKNYLELVEEEYDE